MAPSTFRTKTAKPCKVRRKKRSKEVAPKEFVVMNQNGEFFSGFERGKFRWSLFLDEAKSLERVEQFETIKRLEPMMDLIYDYT
jgi:hypothetical protein